MEACWSIVYKEITFYFKSFLLRILKEDISKSFLRDMIFNIYVRYALLLLLLLFKCYVI